MADDLSFVTKNPILVKNENLYRPKQSRGLGVSPTIQWLDSSSVAMVEELPSVENISTLQKGTVPLS